MPPIDPPLKLGDEVERASKALDLVEVPLLIQLIQLLGFRFRDASLDRRANEEFAALENSLRQSLTHPNIGYLLEVSIYLTEPGEIVLPYGQVLYPIGIGTEPIDALAEHFRKPQLRNSGAVPIGLRNNTFHLWVTRSGENLQAATVPKEFRNYLYAKSREERDRRELLSHWKRTLPHDPFESITRAQYWTEMEQTRAALVQDQTKRQQITELTREMRTLEGRVNVLYQQYQEVQANIARQQKYNNALGTVSSISGIIRSGMELGEIISTSDGSQVTGTQLNAPVDLPQTITITQEGMIQDGRQIRRLRRDIIVPFNGMRDRDNILKGIFGDSGVPIPDSRPLPRSILE